MQIEAAKQRCARVGHERIENGPVADSCVFCGSTEPLTREHVFGQWLGKIGLDGSPVRHKAGPLNRLGRDMGERPPFRQTVKDFCAACNNGWMSQLEVVAQRVLTPLILGQPGAIGVEDQAAIAAWVQKTALTAMLTSSKEQRAAGHGLPATEYTALYERRTQMQPLDATRFWVGRYDGNPGFWSVRVTPLAVRIAGLPEPDQPQGYAMTIVLGQLILHGLRFTTPALEVDVATELDLPQLWPSHGPVPWPSGLPCTAVSFLSFADGRILRSAFEHIEWRPWTPATELPPSSAVRGMVELPTLCGEHTVFYPSMLVDEAAHDRFYAFATVCECPVAYLIQTEPDGAHCKAADKPEVISDIYENLPGQELMIRDHGGAFVCKRLPGEASDAG